MDALADVIWYGPSADLHKPSKTCSECFGTGRAVGYGERDELIWIDCECPPSTDNSTLVDTPEEV